MPVLRLRPRLFWCFAMRPSHTSSGATDLFRERLEAIIALGHPLVRLAGIVPWSRFDKAFGGFYRQTGQADPADGRSALPQACP
jgi:hypothetical protein